MQMMSGLNGGENGNNILNNFANFNNQDNNNSTAEMFKNLNNPVFQNLFKNMQNGNNNNNILSMLPLLQNMFNGGGQKNKEKETAEKPVEIKNDNYLKPISKIANKDITYALNRYFS